MGQFFEWDQGRFGLGIEAMDDEHKTIVGYMNRLHALHAAEVPAVEQGKVLDDLASFTAKHFADEEAYMARIGFPDLGKHKLIHKSLLERVLEYQAGFRKTGKLDQAVFPFLSMWLKAHICGIDSKYSTFQKAA